MRKYIAYMFCFLIVLFATSMKQFTKDKLPDIVEIIYYEDLEKPFCGAPASILYREYQDELLHITLTEPSHRRLSKILLNKMLRENHALGKEYIHIIRRNILAPDTIRTEEDWKIMLNRDNWRCDTVMTQSQMAVILDYSSGRDTVFMDYYRPGNMEFRKKGYVDSLFFAFAAITIYDHDSDFGHKEFHIGDFYSSDTLFCLKKERRKEYNEVFKSLLRKR